MKEKFDLENFPTSESGKRQLGYVSEEFYEKSYVGKWLYQVMGLQYDEARRIVEELPEQMFPETATWGLMYHEIKWGLPVRENLSIEERRKLIYEKRDYRAPMTPYRMEKHLRDITDFEVHVSDVHDRGEFYVRYDMLNGAWLLDGSVMLNHVISSFPHPNIFRVIFIGNGTLNVRRVKKTLDRIKQSHTVYILCEWILAELDNRELESIELNRLEIQIWAPFFMCILLNGAWLLDGFVNLGQSVICGMDMELMIGPIWLFGEERVELENIISSFIHEQIKSLFTGMEIGSGVVVNHTCGYIAADMSFKVWENTKVEEGFVTIKKNLWTLDGTDLLNGSRFLNAERREECL